MQHLESGEPNPSEGPQTGEESCPPAKIRKVEDKRVSGADSTASASPSSEPAGEGEESPHKESAKPESSPCTCRCGGCCCHGTFAQHCVRCHTDYTFNHPEACMVPHVFAEPDASDYPRDATVLSVCCGSSVCGGEPVKGDWRQG